MSTALIPSAAGAIELYYEETGQGVSIDLIRRLGFVRVQDFNQVRIGGQDQAGRRT